ncbi:MAG: ROK family protein [Fimbriimonas sp.]|nr:ROK family protein [Fimbriimonas sp.]
METYWGIDLGGTKIEGVVMPHGSDKPICRHRIDTEADQGYAHIVERVGLLLSELETESGIDRPDVIGYGTPGAMEPATGLMKNCNTTCLNGQPLPADLERVSARRAIVANDANCFALAEAVLGAAVGAASVFGVIMGTGVGGGIVINGRVHNGAQGIGGEWGHNVLIPDGVACYCGKRGCVETVLSGTGLQNYYQSLSGVKRKLEDIVALESEDDAAKQTMERLIENFGKGIAVVINILDPEVIVLGGGVGNVKALYTRGVESAGRFVFNTQMRTKIVPPKLGDSAGVFGAAMLTR